ncbi:hypothetical protein HAX54_013728 [Datura stramonium]|uniref:Uncharacterized protein n=1 Tax=Datura stramonium TaxID=4076 RepID=A0ABS8TLR1_DATST|nr:hypothetical protein [Datura stramonium]
MIPKLGFEKDVPEDKCSGDTTKSFQGTRFLNACGLRISNINIMLSKQASESFYFPCRGLLRNSQKKPAAHPCFILYNHDLVHVLNHNCKQTYSLESAQGFHEIRSANPLVSFSIGRTLLTNSKTGTSSTITSPVTYIELGSKLLSREIVWAMEHFLEVYHILGRDVSTEILEREKGIETGVLSLLRGRSLPVAIWVRL